ncbi:hypothetical protein PVAG01_00134 [Phlyctema vagabunda]|uniref:Uncharacterized protein n=1 Tax=Phlyctema vagabunda TaxID=108571 RepID=A0ABR4PTD1_9HELO
MSRKTMSYSTPPPYESHQQAAIIVAESEPLMDEEKTRRATHDGTPTQKILTTILLVASTLTLLNSVFFLVLTLSRHSRTTHTTIYTCGNSSLSALAHNCTYDALAVSWVPAACADPASLREYDSNGPWKYYRDREGTDEIRVVDLGMEEYYTTVREHVVHCGMIWRRVHRTWERSQKEGIKIESSMEPVSLEHTKHCSYMLVEYVDKSNATELSELKTRNNPGFETCTITR